MIYFFENTCFIIHINFSSCEDFCFPQCYAIIVWNENEPSKRFQVACDTWELTVSVQQVLDTDESKFIIYFLATISVLSAKLH